MYACIHMYDYVCTYLYKYHPEIQYHTWMVQGIRSWDDLWNRLILPVLMRNEWVRAAPLETPKYWVDMIKYELNIFDNICVYRVYHGIPQEWHVWEKNDESDNSLELEYPCSDKTTLLFRKGIINHLWPATSSKYLQCRRIAQGSDYLRHRVTQWASD